MKAHFKELQESNCWDLACLVEKCAELLQEREKNQYQRKKNPDRRIPIFQHITTSMWLLTRFVEARNARPEKQFYSTLLLTFHVACLIPFHFGHPTPTLQCSLFLRAASLPLASSAPLRSVSPACSSIHNLMSRRNAQSLRFSCWPPSHASCSSGSSIAS